MTILEADWKRMRGRDQLRLLCDLPFRQRVIDECFEQLREPPPTYRRLSAADRVIRNVLADRNLRISAFITFNPNDFEDVCKKFRRKILC